MFQKTVDIILVRFKWQPYLVHIVYIIVFSSTFEEHRRLVADTLRALRAAVLSRKPKKCAFFDSLVHCLGYTVRSGHLELANRNGPRNHYLDVPNGAALLTCIQAVRFQLRASFRAPDGASDRGIQAKTASGQ